MLIVSTASQHYTVIIQQYNTSVTALQSVQRSWLRTLLSFTALRCAHVTAVSMQYHGRAGIAVCALTAKSLLSLIATTVFTLSCMQRCCALVSVG
jgi:hypothetical protein